MWWFDPRFDPYPTNPQTTANMHPDPKTEAATPDAAQSPDQPDPTTSRGRLAARLVVESGPSLLFTAVVAWAESGGYRREEIVGLADAVNAVFRRRKRL